ncbi:23S rRNA (uracil(1939)-C(5))-methyltransferase RlmD [Tepidibacillus fermentans]|uniref:23S rRNA m(5)U-1939 methyltransferase n=1 Tax=Tepidibacillus fermentans TaxID=1281767 RepID=A0A4R3KGT6_9BACI|nr:23S rRNA (uracil(1939)-C(5))-methyltransferase RlmD [Tepidibacillus fermentans]TCS82567.1 23S rRNA m(5)U-1939 methyltransferase [Tepidibacillus fermentans]
MKQKIKTSFHIGQVVEVEIKKIGINGEGVGYINRQVLFVPGALPTEIVVAKIEKVEKNFVIAKLIKIKKRSKQRIKPLCSVYEQCGGCTLQHLDYEGQLDAKRELVREAVEKYANLKEVEIRPTIGMDNPWDYRNKAQLPLREIKGKVLTGLYEMGSHRLVDISSCPIQHPKVNEMIQVARDVIQELGIPIYDERKRKGIIKHLVARVGFETEEAQLTLITATEEIPRIKELILELRYRLPYLKSIMQNINPLKTSIIFGNKTKILWGEERIIERLNEIEFSLSPRAFFQLNPEQTVKLYTEVEKAAALTGNEVVIDAYCGVGTIGLWLAKSAKEVHGMDIIKEAIEDARKNAEAGGYTNVKYTLGKAEEILPKWVNNGFQIDVLIVDPPRTGLDSKLLETILQVKPKRFIYVSCNPSTLGKDLAILLKGGYQVEYIQPIDMFPQTSHVESVAKIVLTG